MTRKTPPAQPPLFSKKAIAPMKEGDALDFADLAPYRYRCRCGNTAQTRKPLPAVTCSKCGAAMPPEDEDPTAHEREHHE